MCSKYWFLFYIKEKTKLILQKFFFESMIKNNTLTWQNYAQNYPEK